MQPRYQEHKDLSSVTTEIRNLYRHITNLSQRGTVSTTLQILTGSGGGGGTGGTRVDNMRVETGSVTANTLKQVIFAKSLSTSPTFVIALIVYVDSATNGWTFAKPTNITTTGFEIAANEILFDGTLTYLAAIAS